MTTEERAITVRDPQAWAIMSVEQATAAWDHYQKLCASILTDDDHAMIQGKRVKRKSAWRKLGRFYSLSEEDVVEDIHRGEDGRIIWARYKVRMTAPNGQAEWGSHGAHFLEKCCPVREGKDCDNTRRDHRHCVRSCDGYVHWGHDGDIAALAHTRAKNRAIADLIGCGETSAEEMDGQRRSSEHADSDPPPYLCKDHGATHMRVGNDKAWYCATKVPGQGGKEFWCRGHIAAKEAWEKQPPATRVTVEQTPAETSAASGGPEVDWLAHINAAMSEDALRTIWGELIKAVPVGMGRTRLASAMSERKALIDRELGLAPAEHQPEEVGA